MLSSTDAPTEHIYINKKKSSSVACLKMKLENSVLHYWYAKTTTFAKCIDAVNASQNLNIGCHGMASETGGTFDFMLCADGSTVTSWETITSFPMREGVAVFEIMPTLGAGAKETKKSYLKNKRENINTITSNMSGHSVIVDSVDHIARECSGKIHTIWHMVDEDKASEAVETLLASVPDGNLSELFAFNTSKPDAKLDYTAKVLMKYYVPNVVNASASLDTSHQSAVACINLALSTFCMKEGGAVAWDKLRGMVKIEEGASAKAVASPSGDVVMG